MEENNILKIIKKIKELKTVIIGLVLIILGGLFLVISFKLKDNSFISVFFRDLSFALFPAGIISIAYQYYTEQTMVSNITEAVNKKMGCNFCKNEFLDVYKSRNDSHLNDFFKKAQRVIRILTTNLASLENDLQDLIEKAKKDVKVSILTLNPRHEFLIRRYKDLRQFEKAKDFFEEMIVNLRKFCNEKEKSLKNDDKSNFEIRLYDNPPTLMLFQSDDEVIIGFILRKGRASKFIHIKFNCSDYDYEKENKYCGDFLKHFDNIWKDATEISAERINDIKWDDKLEEIILERTKIT